jgi:hypothetical protein
VQNAIINKSHTAPNYYCGCVDSFRKAGRQAHGAMNKATANGRAEARVHRQPRAFPQMPHLWNPTKPSIKCAGQIVEIPPRPQCRRLTHMLQGGTVPPTQAEACSRSNSGGQLWAPGHRGYALRNQYCWSFGEVLQRVPCLGHARAPSCTAEEPFWRLREQIHVHRRRDRQVARPPD